MDLLLSKTEEDYSNMFTDNRLHQLNGPMASVFWNAIQKIHKDYNDDASNIWKGVSSGVVIISRVREFNGSGPKIASMTANLLVKHFDVDVKCKICIDIAVDTHVKRVSKRLGLVSQNATNEDIINMARELHPEYPGILDCAIWSIGRAYCGAGTPKCVKCPLNRDCEYNKKNHQ